LSAEALFDALFVPKSDGHFIAKSVFLHFDWKKLKKDEDSKVLR